MKSLYIVAFAWNVTPVKVAELEPVFGAIGNWVRLNYYTWLVWTEHSGEQIYNALKSYLNVDDQIVIIGADISHRFGWAPKWFWNWLDDRARLSLDQNANPHRNPPTGPKPEPAEIVNWLAALVQGLPPPKR